MTHVLAAAALPPTAEPPPGVDRAAYHAALLADTVDLLDDLDGVTAYDARGLGDTPAAVLDALHATGATIGALVTADAPDLPGLLAAKLLGSCEDRPAGVLPASDGRLVGLACRLPRPAWLDGVTLDVGLDWLHARAPRGAVAVGPGWRRLRAPGDVGSLDPRLDGFWSTRALLSGQSS